MAPLTDMIIDVYIDIAPRYKAWVQDVSPFLPGSQRLENALFQWDEVMQRIEERKEGANEDEESVVELRVADA